MVQPARAVQCNGSPATGNERRCVQRVASASRNDSQATGAGSWQCMRIALMVCSGPRPNECAVFEQKKRQGRDERRSLSGPQQLSRFESRESATVAGRAVSTTTRWAALLGHGADARPELSVLAPTESAQQTYHSSEPGPRRGESPAHTHPRPPSGLPTVQHTPTAITHRSTTSGPALTTKAWCTRPPHAREGRTTHLLFIPAAPTTSAAILLHGRARGAPGPPAGKP